MGTLKLFNIGDMVTFSHKENSMISLKNMEILISNGKIIEIGSKVSDADQLFDCEDKLVTPGFVDCHTHPVFVDDRENEFEMRSKGSSYEDIANAGGGINSSVIGVRNSSEKELYNRVISRMDKFLKLGTTTIEAKSGYGLNTNAEIKSLKVLHEVNLNHQIDIVPTFMVPMQSQKNIVVI